MMGNTIFNRRQLHVISIYCLQIGVEVSYGKVFLPFKFNQINAVE